ncbi:MAG: class I SAM-dependent methyltransferase [Treponema sp.]|nr:class I SAM-dependent methyltransferase [Treponema sp.]
MSDKDYYQAELLANRLSKRYKQLRKWARKERVTCYRLYDRDIPEVPIAIDLYELLPAEITDTISLAKYTARQLERYTANDPTIQKEVAQFQYIVLTLYERPYKKPEDEEQVWLSLMKKQIAIVTGIDESHIILKIRKHDKGGSQYATDKNTQKDSVITGVIQEQGQLFYINLSNYLDTGLFFDHRPLRALIRAESSTKNVLNLYCYTASFSVYAAQGNAKHVDSVDLSNTYLTWAKQNMHINGFTDQQAYQFIKSDVKTFLDQKAREDSKNGIYDIIILDPPTFSNSKMTQTMLDINKDWSTLVNTCLKLLTKDGTLFFSTNSQKLKFDPSLITGKSIDITASTIPEDFKGSKTHRCWKITH